MIQEYFSGICLVHTLHFNSHKASGEKEKDFKPLLSNPTNESVSALRIFTYISLSMHANHKTTEISQLIRN